MPAWLVMALCPVMAMVAATYAAVGLGGGTGYLAVMALAGVPVQSIASTALVLNIIVAGAAVVRFGLAGRLRWDVFLPFFLPAIPAAFGGGLIRAPRNVFLWVLALALAAAAVAMLRSAQHAGDGGCTPSPARRWSVGVVAGLAIGFVSGFVGIGGGVFLGPTILLLGWAGPKEVAAMSSALVLVVSAVGLLAQGLRGAIEPALILPFGIAALIGGIAGAHLAERKLSPATLQRVFAVVILVAGLKAGIDAVAWRG